MYTLNKSYINTKKIKHLQCKNVHQWSTFTVAYPGNHNQCQAHVLTGFIFLCFILTIQALTQKHDGDFVFLTGG